MDKQFRVAVLVACHNRRDKTLTALHSLLEAKPELWELKVYLADDGSTDGTAEAVASLPLHIKIVAGPGNWYWAHSMYQAEMVIDQDYDAILWLNDDVELEPEALKQFEYWNQRHPASILVGQFCDPKTLELTYGGMRRLGRHPFKYETVFAAAQPQSVDTMNGNLVLIPKVVSEVVGNIDGGYAHAYSDIDFGLRAKRHNFDLIVVPTFLGFCPRNPDASKQSLRARWRSIHSPKGSPPRSQLRFLRRHGGRSWPLYFVMPYVRILLGR